jgi:hypothetical protein
VTRPTPFTATGVSSAGLGVLGAYVLGTLVLAAWLIQRRDV